MREISRLIGRDLKALQLDELRRCAQLVGEMDRERRLEGGAALHQAARVAEKDAPPPSVGSAEAAADRGA